MMRAGLIAATLVLGGCVGEAYWNCLWEGRCANPAIQALPKQPVGGMPVHGDHLTLAWLPPEPPGTYKYRIQTVECVPLANLVECFNSGPTVFDHEASGTSFALSLPLPSPPPHSRRIAWRVRACPQDSDECGPWSPPSYFRIGHPGGPVPGDVDNDGKANVVVGDVGYGSAAPLGAVFAEGWPNGVPGPGGGNGIGGSLALADFNGDGNVDALATNGAAQDIVAIAFGGSSMPFASFTSLTPGRWGRVARAGDVNGDGYEDVVLAGGSIPDPLVGLLFGAPSIGQTGPPTPLATGGSLPPDEQIAAPGDLNGDNYDDVAVVDSNGQVKVFLGPNAQAAPVLPNGPPWPRIAPVGDLDRDGFADLVAFNDDLLVLYLGGPDLGALRRLQWPSSPWKILDAVGGDFWGEGRTQLAVSVEISPETRLHVFEVLPSGGPGSPMTLKGPTQQRIWNPSAGIGVRLAAVGDIDGNGQEDLGTTFVPTDVTSRRDPLVVLFAGRGVDGTPIYRPAASSDLCCTISGVR